MDVLDNKTDEQVLKSLLAETAKAKNEIDCAQRDINKATGRLNFSLVLINELIDRKED